MRYTEPLEIDGYQHHCPECGHVSPSLRRRDGEKAASVPNLFAIDEDGEIVITGLAVCDYCDWEKEFTIGP